MWEWTYDALNMQQRYKRTYPDSTFQEYIYFYGPGDLRLMEFDGQTGIRKMTYRNLDGSLLREYEVLGFGLYQPGNPGEVWTHKKDFLHGPLGLIATRTHGGGARFFFSDHLGSPRVLTNGLGTLTGKHHYYPYGTEYAPGQDDEQQYKYTGHQRDTHGLSDYMRGRTCAFPLQRFMSVDPGRDGWNLYAYVGGNPVKYVDPTGRTAVAAAPLYFAGGSGSTAAGSAAVAATAGPALAVGAGLGLGYGLNQIPGVSEALTFQPVSDVLSEGILVLTRDRPKQNPRKSQPPPTAIPGAKPKVTPAPQPTQADPHDRKQPPRGKELVEKSQDHKKKTTVEKLVDAVETIVDLLEGAM